MLWIGVCLLPLILLAHIRLAPSAVERWHVAPEMREDRDFNNGVFRCVITGGSGLRRFDRIVDSDPRTKRLAGTVEQGMITYITRSRMIGFPDYTTVLQAGEELLIHARSRFGRRDFGVNAVRVERWIDALTAY